MNDRLYRSRDERMFAGVAGGVAERLDLDPSLVRIVWLILIFLTGGLFFLLYVVMAIVVPEAPAGGDQWAGWSTGGTSAEAGGVPGWTNPANPATAFAATGPVAGAGSPGSGGSPEAGYAEAGSADAAPPPTSTTAVPDVAPPGGSPAGPSQAPGPSQPPGQPVAPLAPPPAWSPTPYRHERRRGGGAIIGGLILILLGGYFLVRTVFPTIALGSFWPAILVIIGIALVVGSVRPSRG